MTNILDGFAMLPEVNLSDKCPICGKKPHPEKTTKDKKEDKGCLDSKPAKLGCTSIAIIQDLPNYTTAAHHLIPVNQCFIQFPRLAQMAESVGYDINNSKNGLALPTCAQRALNEYVDANGSPKKYGKLSSDDKENVAFTIMKGLDSQWHVGHHAWTVVLDDGTDNYGHHTNYDRLGKTELSDLEAELFSNGAAICEPEEGESGKDVIEALNGLSEEIKEQLESWKLFFVSALAFKYAGEYK